MTMPEKCIKTTDCGRSKVTASGEITAVCGAQGLIASIAGAATLLSAMI